MQVKLVISTVKFTAGMEGGILCKYLKPPIAIKPIIGVARFNTAQLSAPYLIKLMCLKSKNVPINIKTTATKIKHKHKSIKVCSGVK